MTEVALDPTHTALVKDLVAIVESANADEDKLNKARNKATRSADNSLDAMITRIGAINGDLAAETVNAVCDSVATAIAGSNANVRKARKSELKLIMTQRTHARQVFDQLKVEADNRSGVDDLRTINIRAATLGALRIIRKGNADGPGPAVKKFLAAHDHVASDAEKFAKLVSSIESYTELHVRSERNGPQGQTDHKDITHPVVSAVLAAAQLAVEGSVAQLDAMEELLFPEGTERAQDDSGVRTSEETEEEILSTILPPSNLSDERQEEAADALSDFPGGDSLELEMPAHEPLSGSDDDPDTTEEPEVDLDDILKGVL